tara:strand:- start:2269 stop:2829 length:561 start_codon:yes stop_codon:yes gene_type:complete
MYANTEKLLNLFAKKVINQSIRNLQKGDHIGEGKLAESLNYNVKVHTSGAIELDFFMADHGKFVDKGVKGSSGRNAPDGKRKGYKSPYKFKKENIKRGVIESWIARKGIKGRQKKGSSKGGQFMKRKTLAFLIGRSIALYGLPATRFFSNAFRQHYRKLPKEFINAYASDVQKFLKFATNDYIKQN